jgi:hypothetical protein
MEGASVAGIALPEGDPGAVRDAARQLRSVGGGFAHAAGTVGAAQAAVPQWDGMAALKFSDMCADYGGSARMADNACEDAAKVLDGFADDLSAARQKVRRMQEQGQRLETEERNALDAAEDARGRLQGAQVGLKLAAMDAPVDGGAAMEGFRRQITAASGDLSSAVDRASTARAELVRDALEIRKQVEADGIAAANRLRGAADQLPTVIGAPAGGVGGTPVGAYGEKFALGMTIVVVRIGGSRAVLKERTVDGKWRVTVVDGVEGGFEFDPVPGAGVDGGKAGRLGAGADVTAAFLAQHKSAKVYEFPNETLADRFIKYEPAYVPDDARQVEPPGTHFGPNELAAFHIARRYDRWQDRQKPVEEFTEGGLSARADASLQNVAGGGVAAEDVLGRKLDLQNGTSTRYLRTGAELAGHVGLPFEVGGRAKGEAITAVTFDRNDRVSSYSVTISGTAEGHSGFAGSGESQKVGAGMSHHESEGVRYERQMTLDLNDPENRAAVERYVESSGTDPVATARLGDRLLGDARVDERVYDTGATQSGANVDIKIFKFDGSQTVEEAKLTSMEHSNPGGPKVETVP